MITIELDMLKLVILLLICALPSLIFSVCYMIHTINETRIVNKVDKVEVEKVNNNERK